MTNFEMPWTNLELANEAPSDINTNLDGSTYPGKRCFVLASYIFFLLVKTEQAISGTSAVTYKVMESHCENYPDAY